MASTIASTIVSELKAGARLDGGRPGHLLAPHVDHMLERCPASNADVALEQQYDCVACGVGTFLEPKPATVPVTQQ
jgi:hypothetical protein